MKVVTVGGALIDTIAVIDNERIERISMSNAGTAYLLLEEGKKTEAADVSTHTGGGAVNTAVCLARLGHDVAPLIKLGQDQRAETILNRLADEGISTRFAMRDGRAPTGASVLVATHDRNAAVFTFRGANTLLEVKDLKSDAFAVDLVYIAGLSNQSADCFPHIVEMAKAVGATVATNPGIRQLTGRTDDFQKSLPKIDILSINRVEAESLVPSLIKAHGEGGPRLTPKAGRELPPLASRGLISSAGLSMSLAAFFKAMLGRGPKWIVVTDGRHGAYVASKKTILHCSIMPDVVIASTVGAGDAFASTLSAYLAEGADPELAIMSATINAAAVVSVLDTQSGLMKRDALQSRVAKVKDKLKITGWPMP